MIFTYTSDAILANYIHTHSYAAAIVEEEGYKRNGDHHTQQQRLPASGEEVRRRRAARSKKRHRTKVRRRAATAKDVAVPAERESLTLLSRSAGTVDGDVARRALRRMYKKDIVDCESCWLALLCNDDGGGGGGGGDGGGGADDAYRE